jgi:hypothetical protein
MLPKPEARQPHRGTPGELLAFAAAYLDLLDLPLARRKVRDQHAAPNTAPLPRLRYWKPEFDDPLPGGHVRNAKVRLHDVTKDLNRGQRLSLVHFQEVLPAPASGGNCAGAPETPPHSYPRESVAFPRRAASVHASGRVL